MIQLLLAFASSFEAYLATPYPPADGFDVPTPGIVRAAAHGRVLRAEPGIVELEHVFYENHEKREVRSTYQQLSSIEVKAGDIVERRQKIAEGNLRYQIERALPEKLFVPQDAEALVLVDQRARRLALYRKGRLMREVEVGFGQRPGRKRKQGDLKTPKGMYFVVHKSRGPFEGAYGAYYGGHWIKINYPNPYDAKWGLKRQLIQPEKADAIRRDWAAKRLTAQGTPLGGGIGFHGWAGDWSWDDTGWLSWGCVVLHNDDIRMLFDQIPVGAMVVLW